MGERWAFRKAFRSVGPAVTPVIHVADERQALGNVRVAISTGVAGVFLINHDFPMSDLLPVIRAVRARWPALWLGVNFLGVSGADAFPVLGRLAAEGCAVDAYWADDARIDEHRESQDEAQEIDRVRAASGWQGLYFGGVAFKKQRHVAPADWARAAAIARPFVDVVTTSGPATGEAAEARKITAFRAAIGDAPLALASGVTPENAPLYGADVDCFLVATGINRPGDFYNIDPARLALLMRVTREIGGSHG